MKQFRYIDDVVTLSLDPDACIGCGMCTQVCPHAVLALDSRRSRIRIMDRDGCMECGACANNCPTQALSLTPGVGCAAYIIQKWIRGKRKNFCEGAGYCC